jgi:ABC-type lipoprotein export system ATPase subunit
MIELKNISKAYARGREIFNALSDVSITVNEGEFLVINGPSGAGKSTLLYIIGGLIQPDSGSVNFRETDLYSRSSSFLDEYRKTTTGFMFQQFHLMPYLTVKENILLSCSTNDCAGRADDLLKSFKLSYISKKYPGELSVGEKQRTAFIRALINDPAVLLADEPTGNLDPENASLLLSLMAEYHLKGGTVIMVSHHKVPDSINARKLVLDAGRLDSAY